MAKLFLDTNAFIDVLEERGEVRLENLKSHQIYVSPLSFHICSYIYNIDVNKTDLNVWLKKFSFVDFSKHILSKSIQGPTKDLEDNIQLHSAAEAEADYFITRDENLLKMTFFGKAAIKKRIQ